MSILLSGSRLRNGGSGEFLPLASAMPQLPETTSTTGFTLITNNLLQTRYSSSLGNIEFDQSQMYSNFPSGTVRILMTGTTSISTSTASGTLVVTGGVGIGKNLWVKEDIHVNDLTIGQGVDNGNNIAFIGTYTDITQGDGQNVISIGFDTLTKSKTAYNSIAIGNKALGLGAGISNSIAIGVGALGSLGSALETIVATIQTATQTNPVLITTVGLHGLVTGDRVLITNVVGMTQLNDNKFYVEVTDTNKFKLYNDLILNSPINGTGYTAYTPGSGTVSRYVFSSNNIAIGSEAGALLIEGRKNFFFGDRVGDRMTNGSSNVFIGSDVARNMITGNGNISISGDNLVDGVDNQINIGSVFYYDGSADLSINSNASIGLGQESTSTSSGALVVSGGISTEYSVYSREGNPDENYLLYTPRVFVSNSKPSNPRVADFWIFNNGISSSYLQYVRDGTDTFWLQVGAI